MLLGQQPPARAAVRFLLLVTGLILALFAAVFALHYVTPLDEAKEFVDIGAEANLPTWWNSALLFLVAALAAASALVARGGTRRSWAVIAAAAAYLSLDEAARLHERLARPLLAAGLDTPTYPWLALGAVVGIAGATVLFFAGRSLPAETGRRLALGLGCYGAGALGAEAFNGWIRQNGPDYVFSAGLILEEGLEMFGCIIAAGAIADYLAARLLRSRDLVVAENAY
ncbi:MAG TPA: hypothetical protein VHH13_13435 [Arthrobacter sp.]|nr:hypothetical protein [Arthrobacter sp.]